MAFHRRTGNRFSAAIWPGFVDAITALLMVMIFVLTIFMVVQFVLSDRIAMQDDELDALSDQIATQDNELDALNAELNALSDALGLEQARSSDLETRLATLGGQLSDAQVSIASFEEQVASLLARQADLRAQVDSTRAELAETLSREEALNLALAQARNEIDSAAEAARLAAARREALEALLADLRSENSDLQTQLSEEEAARMADAAAAQALRERLANSDAELTALTLVLEEERARAEETLTLLAGARAAQENLPAIEDLQSQLSEREALLAVANAELATTQAQSTAAQRRVVVLNEQLAALRAQLAALENILDESEARDEEAQVQIDALGTRLNTALAQVAAEQRARADLEAAEAQRLERYRSDFFGRLREVLEGRDGVRIVGDRFVFSSEVLFESARADLSPEGRAQIANVAELLFQVSDEVPDGIDWIIRVDGHTDNVPLSANAEFSNNWELSQARALSVVIYMNEELGIPAERLAATGFGEFHPVAEGDSAAARAQNRRIELKLTER